MKKTLYITLLLSIIFALLLSACGPSATAAPALEETPVPSSAVIAEGRIEPIHAANLSFLAMGVVDEVNVAVGDSVQAGDVLVKLAGADIAQAQVVAMQQAYDQLLRTAKVERAHLWQVYMDAQKAREAATKKWNDINLNDIENRIEDRQEDVEDRQIDLEQAQEKFDKYKDLNEDDVKYRNAEDELEDAQSEYDEAVENLEETMRERDVPRANLDAALAAEAETKYQYELTLEGPNADQLALAKANLDAALDGLEAYILTAPFDGIVAEVNVKMGEQVGPESRAVSVIDPSAWMVETTDVTELEVVKIAEGQQVSMVPDALPDVTLTGTVTEISQAYFIQGGDVQYTVRIQVDEVDARIRWGMTVEATFEATGN
ncbi:MAG: efflux RND transporter periplasmic adaptor subunit [Chloroflexota bacterium]